MRVLQVYKTKGQNMLIEKNVKIPEGSGKGNMKGTSKYPWPDMIVGDSVFVPSVTMKSSAVNYAYKWMARNGRKSIARAENGGVRVWRVL